MFYGEYKEEKVKSVWCVVLCVYGIKDPRGGVRRSWIINKSDGVRAIRNVLRNQKGSDENWKGSDQN